jgi:hypothetical protein
MGCFSALWLSITRLIVDTSDSLFDLALCVMVTLAFLSGFVASFLSKTSGIVPRSVPTSWCVHKVMLACICVCGLACPCCDTVRPCLLAGG